MFNYKSREEDWDADSMIRSARSLQYLVNDFYINDFYEESPPFEDSLLSFGKLQAAPVLLTLAIEIALKAWQCWERKEKPDHRHDLLELFDGLEETTQTRLAGKLSEEAYLPLMGMREVLDFHRKTFECWRYLYEVESGAVYLGTLDKILTAIIEAYDEMTDELP